MSCCEIFSTRPVGRARLIAIAAIIALMPMLALANSTDEGQRSVETDGAVKLSVHIDKSAAQVADPIQLMLEVDAPRGTRVEMPQLSGELGDFEVRNSELVKDIPSPAIADGRRWVVRATLETIKTGELTIPPLDVQYATDSKSSTFKTLRSKPLPIRIASVLENRADLKKFHDIKDVSDVAVPEQHSYAWLGWISAGVVATAALAALALFVMRRRRGPSPAEWALAAIAELEQLSIANGADTEAVYNEGVDIVREFFELEFNVPTLSQTTREFLAQAVKAVGLGETARERLTSLASLADEIKFARLGVGEAQVRQALEQAKAFIRECEEHRMASEREAA